MPKLSLIIPVYNVEAYVGRTLGSVFETTASAADFEVIVVNDGTKDGSMDVVRRFADKSNLIILEQENQGLSAARMNGLALAKGDYIWFIDSDDYLVEDGVGKVLRLLEERPDAEVLMFPLMRLYEGASEGHLDYRIEGETIMSGYDVIKNPDLKVYSVVRFVIKRSLAAHPSLYFPLGRLHEDEYYGAVLMCLAKQVNVLDEYVYVHLTRSGSIMTTLQIRSSYDIVAIHRMLMRFLDEHLEPGDRHWFRQHCMNMLMTIYIRQAGSFDMPGFCRFTCRNGLYVWRQWLAVTRDKPVRHKAGRLFYFLMPRFRERILSAG